jgi:UDP-glucose-4-epimerase GalE
MAGGEGSAGERDGVVLIAGGAGYIGSHTVRHFAEQGERVVVLDNLSTGHRELVPDHGTPFALVDLKDRAGLDACFREHAPRSVVHFAARTYVGESVADPSRYYQENVIATWNLLEAMRAHGCREIVFSSSCATYGEPQRLPIDEGHPQQPISPYGRTKLHMEHMMEDYSRAYGLRFAALRYFNAAGASPRGDLGELHDPETHLIPLVLEVALGRRADVKIFGDDYPTPDGTCIRDYIHVDDLASAHLLALRLLRRGRERFVANLGTGRGYSVREVITTAERVTGRRIRAEVVGRRPGDPPELVSGGTRAALELGWKAARSSLEDIIADAWGFLCKHPQGP